MKTVKTENEEKDLHEYILTKMKYRESVRDIAIKHINSKNKPSHRNMYSPKVYRD